MDRSRIAAAFSALAEEFGTPDAASPAAPAAPAANPAPRGRGRGVKPSTDATTAPTAPAVTVVAPVAEPDPFAAPAAPAAPTATLGQVREALTNLKNATSQEIAVSILKTVGGADNLTALSPTKYGDVVTAATKALPAPRLPPPPVVEEDPFAVPAAAPAAAAAKAATIEDVKAAATKAQARAGIERAKGVVMAHGGKKVDPAGGPEQVSFNALPAAQYAATIAALNALPTTK